MRVVLSAQRAIKLRESFGLSVPEMAHKLSISVSNIYRVELKGLKKRTPLYETYVALEREDNTPVRGPAPTPSTNTPPLNNLLADLLASNMTQANKLELLTRLIV